MFKQHSQADRLSRTSRAAEYIFRVFAVQLGIIVRFQSLLLIHCPVKINHIWQEVVLILEFGFQRQARLPP